MDMFDWLGVIQKQKESGKTQQEIGESIGWSIDQVKKYCTLQNKVPHILDIAKEQQAGRGTGEVPNGTFNFTEGWFRNSGLYELEPERQEQFIKSIILYAFLTFSNTYNLAVDSDLYFYAYSLILIIMLSYI